MIRGSVEMNINRLAGQLKWMPVSVTLTLGSLITPTPDELHRSPGRMLKIRRALPLQSLLTISLRLPSVFAIY